MLEPICFSLSDEVGLYHVIKSLTESVGSLVFVHRALYSAASGNIFVVCIAPPVVLSFVLVNTRARFNSTLRMK